MKPLFSIAIPLCVLFSITVHAQTNFKTGWEKADPVPSGSDRGLEEKLTAHKAFLDAATTKKDTLLQLYGLLYLFYDELDAADLKEATRYLLEAESLAKNSGDAGWQGAVSYRRGVLYLGLERYTDAIASYRSAVSLCRTAGDSLCVGIALEQLGAAYGMENDHERSDSCYLHAFPLIEAYGDHAALSAALTNFGAMLVRQERPSEAIIYLDRAVALSQKSRSAFGEVSALNNLSEAYFMLNRHDDALATLHRCVAINTEQGFTAKLITNYQGLANVYQAKGDLPNALLFTTRYYDLHDSLVGASTQLEVADLEARYNGQQKELDLQKSQAELAASNHLVARGVWLLCSILFLAGAGLWRWRIQVRHAKQESERTKGSLIELTRLLLDKNTRIGELEEQTVLAVNDSPVPALPVPPTAPRTELSTPETDTTFYNKRILTDEDWALFKLNFEKAYPGYLLRLRAAFPTLSNAEERLVLFIKLNLNTKESAAILGISADSVKRGRNRLRKRLQLAEEVDLDSFVRAF